MKKGRIIIYTFLALLMSFLFIDEGKAINAGKVSSDIEKLRSDAEQSKLLKDETGIKVGEETLEKEYGLFSLARPINRGMNPEVSNTNKNLLVGSKKTGATLKKVCYDWGTNMYNSFTNADVEDYEANSAEFFSDRDNDSYKCVKKTNDKEIVFHQTAEIARATIKNKKGKEETIKSAMKVRYKKVGKYGKKWIDVEAKINNLAIGTGLDGEKPIVHLYPGNFGVSVGGVRWVSVTYTFYEEGTNTPISVKGNTSYWDIDGYQGIILADNSNKGIYVDASCKLKVGTIQGYKYIFDDGSTSSGSSSDLNAAFTETFEGSSITRIYQFADHIIAGDPFTWYKPKGGIMHFRKTVPDNICTDECCDEECEKTPTYTYNCEETSQYGRCRIRIYEDGKPTDEFLTTSSINCNDSDKYGKGISRYKKDDEIYKLDNHCPFKPKYNYDVDIACEDCEGTSKNGSYHIQDTTDWEAILHTNKRNDNPTLQDYFKETAVSVYCRDEFIVSLPNANTNKIYAQQGRYITVNKINPISGIDNFAPIKVTRIRQCLSKKDKDKDGKFNGMSLFSKKKFGNISLKYEEKKYSHEFSGEDMLIIDRKTEIDSSEEDITINSRYPSEVPNATYTVKTQKKSAYFVLPDYAYRKVVVGGGEERINGTALVKTSNKVEKKVTLRDVGTANLPISFANKNGATIKLNFVLPDDTKLINAVNNNKLDFLGNDSTEKDIYNQNGNEGADDNPYRDTNSNSSTACAKMYGFGTEKYKECVKNKSNHANCLTQLKPDDYTYSCDIKTCSSEEDAKRLGVSWNAKLQKCGSPGNDSECKTKQDAERLGLPWDSETGKCCSPELDEQIHNAEPYKCDYDKKSSGTCSYDRCPVTRLCRMPDGSCPGFGPVIYRTIDLNNPFPGQSGKDNGRDTGSNWCRIDGKNVYRCSGKPSKTNETFNQTVYDEIINNRGVTGYAIYNHSYDEDYALYKIELDASAIRAIREKNKEDDYDDWTYIKYDSGNKVYYSTFLNNTFGSQKIQGRCMKSNSAKKVCAEG